MRSSGGLAGRTPRSGLSWWTTPAAGPARLLPVSGVLRLLPGVAELLKAPFTARMPAIEHLQPLLLPRGVALAGGFACDSRMTGSAPYYRSDLALVHDAGFGFHADRCANAAVKGWAPRRPGSRSTGASPC